MNDFLPCVTFCCQHRPFLAESFVRFGHPNSGAKKHFPSFVFKNKHWTGPESACLEHLEEHILKLFTLGKNLVASSWVQSMYQSAQKSRYMSLYTLCLHFNHFCFCASKSKWQNNKMKMLFFSAFFNCTL